MISSISTSTVNWPGHLCHTVYTKGCNLRCPFCYNWHLFEENNPPDFDTDDCIDYLMRNKKRTKYVCVTGGEPTIHKEELESFIFELVQKDFKIKLDTNGLEYKTITHIAPLISYLAMDLKAPLSRYGDFDSNDNFPNCDFEERFQRTMRAVTVGNSLPFLELRTTAVPEYLDINEMCDLVDVIERADKYTIQQYHPEQAYKENFREMKPYSDSYLQDMVDRLKFVYKLKIPIEVVF